jgi:hypothetical protein
MVIPVALSPQRLILCAAMAATLAGCLDITATLSADGGGDLDLTLAGIDAAQEAQVVTALTSPHVQLLKHELADGSGHFHVRVADVAQLHTAPFFRNLRIQRHRAAQRETLVVILPRHKPPPKGSKGEASLDDVAFAMHLTVPGEIVETNADRKSGATAHWTFKMRTLTGKGEVGMKVVYDIPPPTPVPTEAPTLSPATPGVSPHTPTAADTPSP